MEMDRADIERPTIITVVCIFGFMVVGTGLLMLGMWHTLARRIGAWYPPSVAASTVVMFLAYGGMWRMRRWAVILYTAAAIAGNTLMAVMGHFSIAGAAISLAVVIIGFTQFHKMR